MFNRNKNRRKRKEHKKYLSNKQHIHKKIRYLKNSIELSKINDRK